MVYNNMGGGVISNSTLINSIHSTKKGTVYNNIPACIIIIMLPCMVVVSYKIIGSYRGK